MSAVKNTIGRLIEGVDKLNSFESPEEVVKFFRDMGYKGSSANAKDCIVARFLKDCVGDPDAGLSVTAWDAHYIWPRGQTYLADGNPRNVLNLTFSSVMRAFVERWDGEEWPDLLETEDAENETGAETETESAP